MNRLLDLALAEQRAMLRRARNRIHLLGRGEAGTAQDPVPGTAVPSPNGRGGAAERTVKGGQANGRPLGTGTNAPVTRGAGPAGAGSPGPAGTGPLGTRPLGGAQPPGGGPAGRGSAGTGRLGTGSLGGGPLGAGALGGGPVGGGPIGAGRATGAAGDGSAAARNTAPGGTATDPASDDALFRLLRDMYQFLTAPAYIPSARHEEHREPPRRRGFP